MLKRSVIVIFALALLVPFAACKKKETTPPAPQTMPQQEMPPGHPGVGPGQAIVPPTETNVTVPDIVKGWKSVVLDVQDKTTGKSQDVNVKLGGSYKIPGSDITVEPSQFLPDFKMEGSNITSVSNEPNNPAVKVKVTEGGKEIFNSWLYAKFPQIHPFQHEKYAITLKEGKKS